MIVLLLKASFILAILLAFYKMFLEKESFFSNNRIYLIGCIFLTFTLPFVQLPELIPEQGIVTVSIEKMTNQETQEDFVTSTETTYSEQAFKQKETLSLEESNNNKVVENTPEVVVSQHQDKPLRSWTYWLLLVYYFGLLIFSFHLVSQLISIWLKTWNSDDKIADVDCIIVNTPSAKEPCSFFKYIFINPESYDYDTYEQILEHERIHVQKRHTLDLLLSELAVIVLWFNPFVWLFRKEVEKNIEYQTDDLLLNGEAEKREPYQMSLLKIATYNRPLTVTTNYNQSLLKQRILKMNTKKSNPHSYWKYAFILPMLFGLLLIVNEPNKITAQSAFTESTLNEVPETSILTKEKEVLENRNINLDTEEQSDITDGKDSPEIPGTINLVQTSDNTITDCDELREAAKNKDYNKVREILNNRKTSNCATNPDGSPSDNHELIRGLLSNGANIDIGANGSIRIYGTSEIISWGDEDTEIKCTALKEAADNKDISKIRDLLLAYNADCFTDDDGTINDFSYIKELLRKDANIRVDRNSEIIIYGTEVNINFLNFDENSSNQDSGIINSECTELLKAIRAEDISKVKELLKTADPNCVNKREDHDLIVSGQYEYYIQKARTPLVAAARIGNLEIGKLLVDAGAKVTFHAKGDETAVIAAAGEGSLDFVKYLEAKGADINEAVKHRGTALSAAAREGHMDVVKYLVAQGVEVDISVAHVGSPLMKASGQGHIEIVKYLISKGANVNKSEAHVGTPLLIASREGEVEIVKHLISQGADINKGVAHVGTPLLVASREGELEIVKYLLSKNADLNKQIAHVGTPLLVASREGKVEVVKYLISQGADINKSVAHVGTPLLVASREGEMDMIKYLISQGADVDKSVAHVGTPLLVASREGQGELIKYLISQGANVDKGVAHVGTPLLVASREGQMDMIKYLISQGADVDKSVAHVGTPLLVASREGQIELIKYLISQGADVDKGVAHVGTPLLVASREGQMEVVNTLISGGADIDKSVAHVGTPLLVASREGEMSMIKFLISKGADVDKEVAHVGTPLLVASREGQMKVIEYLVSKGANVNKSVLHVGTPLSAAIKNAENKTAEYLRSKGAK